MKFSEIQKLYRQTEAEKLDKEFFIRLYQFCIDSIEKIDDKIIIKAFKDASICNCNLSQICVSEQDNQVYLELYKNSFGSAPMARLKCDQEFDFHEFCVWISLNPKLHMVVFERINGFDKESAQNMFGEYLIKIASSRAEVSEKFFKRNLN